MTLFDTHTIHWIHETVEKIEDLGVHQLDAILPVIEGCSFQVGEILSNP